MRDPSENDSVRINSPSSPRVRVFRRNGPGLNRNGRYNNSNSNNNNVGNVRPRVRQRIHNADELRRHAAGVARQLFGGNNEGPKSPPKAPKKVNVSKYEKMLKNLENKNKNKNTRNNKPNNENKNVTSWFNNSMTEAKKSNIPKDKRVFLITDMTGDGKIKQVWDRRFLNGLVESYENRYNRVREANDPFFTSPLTRKKFSKNDIKAYPPTNATKRRIKQIVNGRTLESKVNKIMKIKNKDYLAQSNILETIKRGIRKGDITTEKQIVDLALIYEVTGRELLISGHKKDGDYYTAYVKGKFKPHHIKFMKDTPYIATKLYDTTRHVGRHETKTPAHAIVPLYKLPSSAVKYLSGFDKYASGESPVARDTLTLIIRVLRQVVKVGYVPMAENVALRIMGLPNSNLRNKLGEYYEWYELVRNASS